VSGITDILEGFDDWTFEASNINELSNLLHQAYELPNLKLKEIGQQMREKVKNQYAFKTFIKSRENFYNNLK
jgi:hypothetical protein